MVLLCGNKLFTKNFALIDQLKFMQLKFTPTSVNFSILYFGKPIKNQAKQNPVIASLMMI